MRKVDDAPIKNIYGKSGNSQIIEMALRKSFADDAKPTGEPATWSVGDVAEALSTKPKQQECVHGLMILKEELPKLVSLIMAMFAAHQKVSNAILSGQLQLRMAVGSLERRNKWDMLK